MITYNKSIKSWVLVILWMLLIFTLSSQVAEQSSSLSNGITEILLVAMKKVALDFSFDVIFVQFLIRKFAHFFAYFVLGILIINAMKGSSIVGLKCISFPIIISVIYAISDEVHQTFVPGRSGEFRDVLIDGAGVIVGIVLYLVVIKIKKKSCYSPYS